ncbi:MAG TPA: hypothetical protein VK116_12585 [Planctomycetota bacterium]|nr:hypothetical protein [Planctomycetota bacterium]
MAERPFFASSSSSKGPNLGPEQVPDSHSGSARTDNLADDLPMDPGRKSFSVGRPAYPTSEPMLPMTGEPTAPQD